MAAFDAWIDTILKRSAELRRAGILSIECDGCAAVLAPAEPDVGDSRDDEQAPIAEEPVNPWLKPESYPSGVVPRLDVDDKMPEIPTFDDGGG